MKFAPKLSIVLLSFFAFGICVSSEANSSRFSRYRKDGQDIFNLRWGRTFDQIRGIILGAREMPKEAKKPLMTDREQKIYNKAVALFAAQGITDELAQTQIYARLDQTADLDGTFVPPANCALDSQKLAITRSALYAADAAYDIGGPNRDTFVGQTPVGYKFLKLFGTGDPSGFQAIVFESEEVGKPRIYAMAGSQVFERTDWRDIWANLGLGMSHATSKGAEEMLLDAFLYVRKTGDIVITGQSLGSNIAQHFGYFLQRNLNRAAAATQTPAVGKARLITWGVEGSKEIIERTFKEADSNEAYDPSIGEQLDATGYFFEWDPFARNGTFIGKPLAFSPTHLLSWYEKLHAQLMGYGIELEGHFLSSYRRASRKGGLCSVQEVYPAKINKDFTAASEWLGRIGEYMAMAHTRKLTPEERQQRKDAYVQKQVLKRCGEPEAETYPKGFFGYGSYEKCAKVNARRALEKYEEEDMDRATTLEFPKNKYQYNIDASYF
jgi:threonine dehydrogenase-like Zn-dependent dehydrogenase